MAATFRALVPWVKLSQHFILHPIDEDLSLGAPNRWGPRCWDIIARSLPGAIKSYKMQVLRLRLG